MAFNEELTECGMKVVNVGTYSLMESADMMLIIM